MAGFRHGCFVIAALGWPAMTSGQTDLGLRRVAEAYWDARMERYPMQATAIGDYRFNDRLDDYSEAAIDRWQEHLHELQKDLREVPANSLTEEDRLTRALLDRTLEDELLLLDCHLEYMPLEPLDGPHIRFPLILVSQPFRNTADFEAYISRLKAFPKQVDNLIANMQAGAQRKLVSPRPTIQKVIPQIRTHVVDDLTKSEFCSPAGKAENLPEAEREAVKAGIRTAISQQVIPAYSRLQRFAESEYAGQCRETVGMGALPGGDRVYQRLAYLSTSIHISPEEVHRIGLAEVARIRGEMDRVRQEVGFEGTTGQFIAHMRTDPKHRFQTGEELVAAADQLLQRTKPLLPKLFGRLPKTDCVMKEIESFRAPASPVAYYNPSAEDGSRPGYYYINTYQPTERLRFTLEALTYHEAIPGHHFQIALHQENTDLPRFRRYASFNAFVEGWALYTEKLGYEIGGYRDPYSRYGQLTFEMWRACRLVVDTGIHHKGWTRDQAIRYMEENSSLARADIENEVDRYIVWPGQALGYKIGELSILRLRQEAQEKLGDKFDIRAFHDRLLAEGAMPIDMMEARMKDWIASQARTEPRP